MWIDRMSSFLSRYKGLPTMIAVALVVVNFVLGFFPQLGWLSTSNLFLHLAVLIGFVGLMMAAAVG